jgi:tRNA nucleotidyltransferase (CCA-adding enzyme)
MDVIVSHVNADFDSLGGLVGARLLYPGAAMVLPGGETRAVGRFLSLHREALPVLRAPDVDPETITRVIVVDTASRRRLGQAEAWLDLPDVEVHVYDHHTESPPDVEASVCRIEPWGSVSSLLALELQARGESPVPIEATALLLGIYDDTGSLSYSATRPEDLEAAAWLLRCGADLEVVAEFARETLNPEQREVLRDLLAAAEVHAIAGAAVVIAVVQPHGFVSDLAPLAHRLLEVEEADAGVLLAEIEGTTYLIARSRTDSVNVGAAMADLGGGGHARAASARVEAEPAEALKPRVLQALEAHAEPETTARAIMSRPVRSISPETPIAEARARMVRYGHSGLIVLEEGALVGILTRRDVDKARHHRLDHAPARGYMTTGVHTVAPEAPLSELERVMTTEGIGRLPVVRHGEVIGIVTRTDVLRALHGARYVTRPPESEDETARLLRETLPAPVQRLLEEVGRVASREGAQAYAVGGFVRDLLLGVRNLDVDLLAEPDGIALARAVAEETGGEPKAEPRFGTAKVTLPDGFRLDFATARTESYAHPGALPEVEDSSITDDLRRRDFTINAMAVALNPESFGKLLDPFHGKRDLEQRRVRVLHNLSFVDDPTRIFRAVRFEVRYHFEMDRHTEALAKQLIREGGLGSIKPERARAELRRIVQERKPVGALLRLAELGVIDWLLPGLEMDAELLRRLPGAVDWWNAHAPESVDALVVYLAGLLAPAGTGAALAAAESRLRIAPPDLKRLEAALGAAERAAELLPEDGAPAEITRRLRPLPPEALVFLRARVATQGEDRAKRATALERYVTRWRAVKLAITGDLLTRAGFRAGPRLGEALARTLDARLNGEIEGLDQELAYARALLEQSEPNLPTPRAESDR